MMKSSTILELSAKDARDYLLLPSSYCTVNFPDYFDFSKILSFVKKSIGKKDIETCLVDKMPSYYDDVNYKLMINKDGHYAFRRLQLANPFIYYLLVRTITEPNNWAIIQGHFSSKRKPNISVVSLPKVKNSKERSQARVEIPVWWQDYEQESIALALKYRYMFTTDITDCYGSIYTHTIPWSLHGKEYSKEHRQGNSLLGNIIDRYMGSMNNDQTNGIPQGSVLFDLIAEIVLVYADSCLYERLKCKKFSDKDYFVLRYRDDYRLFSNDKAHLEEIVKTLQDVLLDLNFRLNSAKTRMSEDVVRDSIKPDKLAYLSEIPIYKGEESVFSSVQKELFYVLQFAKSYPNSGTVPRLLSKLLNRIDLADLARENMRVLISIAVEIMMTTPRVFNVGMALISVFLNRINDEKAELVKDVYNKFRRMTNTGELELWLQRITYHMDDVQIEYEEPLTKIVSGDSVSIWNNSWLKPEFVAGFPLLSLCDTKKLEAQTPVILPKEVSVFEY